MLNAHSCTICSHVEEIWEKIDDAKKNEIEKKYEFSLNFFSSELFREKLVEHMKAIQESTVKFSELSLNNFSCEKKDTLDFLMMKTQFCSYLQTMEDEGIINNSLFSSDEARHEYFYGVIDFLYNSHNAEQLKWYQKLVSKDMVIKGCLFFVSVLIAGVACRYFLSAFTTREVEKIFANFNNIPEDYKSELINMWACNLNKLPQDAQQEALKQCPESIKILVERRMAILNKAELLASQVD